MKKGSNKNIKRVYSNWIFSTFGFVIIGFCSTFEMFLRKNFQVKVEMGHTYCLF